jgi:class 3 adenylate cyclase
MSESAGTRKRFLTTVLMTDIVGSTEHAAELGDSGWRELVQLHHAVVRAALRRHEGREIDTAGDGFFAVFDAPAAAVDCALEVAQEVGKLGIEIRAGVHVGEVEQIAGKVGGITVVIASRIMAASGAGGVLVSSTVRDLAAGSGLTFQDRGVRELKGCPANGMSSRSAPPSRTPRKLRDFPRHESGAPQPCAGPRRDRFGSAIRVSPPAPPWPSPSSWGQVVSWCGDRGNHPHWPAWPKTRSE